MQLVLGSERYDLRDRTVILARVAGAAPDTTGADALWVDPHAVAGLRACPLPIGVDARSAAHVHELVDAGAVAVGVPAGHRDVAEAAQQRGTSLLVHPSDTSAVAGGAPPERLLVRSNRPVDGGVACCVATGRGPAAWGDVAVALAAGVRVVLTPEPASIRRVAVVVERLAAAREALVR